MNQKKVGRPALAPGKKKIKDYSVWLSLEDLNRLDLLKNHLGDYSPTLSDKDFFRLCLKYHGEILALFQQFNEISSNNPLSFTLNKTT